MSFWGEKKINILVGSFPPNDRKEIRDETAWEKTSHLAVCPWPSLMPQTAHGDRADVTHSQGEDTGAVLPRHALWDSP